MALLHDHKTDGPHYPAHMKYQIPNTLTITQICLFSLLLPYLWRYCFCNSHHLKDSGSGEPKIFFFPSSICHFNARKMQKATYSLQTPYLEASRNFILYIYFVHFGQCISPEFPFTCCIMSFLFNISCLEKSKGLSWAFSPELSHWFLEQRETICHLAATTIWGDKLLSEAKHCSRCPERCLPSDTENAAVGRRSFYVFFFQAGY